MVVKLYHLGKYQPEIKVNIFIFAILFGLFREKLGVGEKYDYSNNNTIQ
jgi:hypothetical protein